MDRQEEILLKARIDKLNNNFTTLKIKHDNLSHRVDGLDEELNELWEVVGKKRKDTKQNEK
jgi:archaellum component FlaC